MLKKFELWLDESGDFDNDSQKTGNSAKPSLIGGLLTEINSFPESYINAILPEEGTYHSVNEDDQLERFKLIINKLYQNINNRLVVFSNQERIMVIDNNLTYLNIITAGILQLIKRLKANYGDIFLRIVIANRVDTTTGMAPGVSVVPQIEYEKRLKEKLLLEGLENAISNSTWEIQTSSARKDKRLMLADIVCNTFFTRGRRKKFTDEERKLIEKIYCDESKTLTFKVFESVLEKQFHDNLLENRIGEAVANICLSTDSETVQRCFSLLEQNFIACGIHDIKFQYQFIKSYIEYYINVIRDFDLCIAFLDNLLKFYIPLLDKYSNAGYAELLSLDIKFYLLTVYHHTGKVSESECLENECEELIGNLPMSLDSIDYRIKFNTRKIISLINAFEYSKALNHADKQVERCREIKEVLALISDDQSYFYDEYAKALGTRLQIKTHMLRSDNSLYESAKQDSETAINEFVDQNDKRRQYLYRTNMETEHGTYSEALRFLKMSVGLESSSSITELWNSLLQDSVFGICAFVKLMAEAENSSFSSEMFKELSNSSYLQQVEKQSKQFHPIEVIYWKTAYYYARNGMIGAAEKYYKYALDVCFLYDNMTLNAIGFGIGLEMIGMMIQGNSKATNTLKKQISKKWYKFSQGNHEFYEKLFGSIDFLKDDSDYYLLKSKVITY